MAQWTCATTLERLGELLEQEGLIDGSILDKDDPGDKDAQIPLSSIVSVSKDRIVRDQFSPKAKAQHTAKKAQPKLPVDGDS